MPPHELLVDGARDRLEIAGALLLEQQGEEVDLEEQVTELVRELRVVARHGGVGNLVRLLDSVRNDCPGRLLTVPRAVAPQALGECLKLGQRLGEAQLSPSSRPCWSAMRRDPGSAGSRPGT